MFGHITRISRIWPGITPMNVWEMRYDMWLLYLNELTRIESQNK